MPMPLTALCIVSDKAKCPYNYNCIALSDSGKGANLWHDGYFSSKITRYLCYSRDTKLGFNSYITDIQVVEQNDFVLSDYTIITKTIDTNDQAFKKSLVLMYKTRPLVQTNQAIVDISIFDKDSDLGLWSTVKTINNLTIAYKICSKREIEKNNEIKYENLSYQSTAVNGNRRQSNNLGRQTNNLGLSKATRQNITRKHDRQTGINQNNNFNWSQIGAQLPNTQNNQYPNLSENWNSTLDEVMQKPKKLNANRSFNKVSPISEVVFILSKKIQQSENENKKEKNSWDDYIPNEFCKIDFGVENSVINRGVSN